MKFELTFVVPVYNVENYLLRSIESLGSWLNNEAIAILIVDDGSTDDSLLVACHIEETYNNVSVYHKDNGGLSSDQNFGYSLADGCYVYFLIPTKL